MNNNSRSGGDMFIIGALVGGITALLFAPDKGRSTRNRMMQTARSFKDDTYKRINNAKDAAKNGIDETREKTADAAQTVADRLTVKSEQLKNDHNDTIDIDDMSIK